jgi:hypothetical protein
MCVTTQNLPVNFIFLANEQYEKEVALMRKRMEKLLKKVEKNDEKLCYDKFKASLSKIDHKNLKR